MSLQCEETTGQCPCIEGIIGKRCNQCASKYAEIRLDEEDGTYACRGKTLFAEISYRMIQFS